MHKKAVGDLIYYQFDSLLSVPDLRHGIFTRLGGVSEGYCSSLNVGATVGDHLSHVKENRDRIAATMGVRDSDTRTTWQVHGADVVVVRGKQPQSSPPPQADAIITGEPGIPLEMRFADCVPLVFFDPAKHVIGLAHAGWRGTVSGVGPATVKTMQAAYGCRPEDILAGIGPSIGPCCYEVGGEVVEQVRTSFRNPDDLFHQNGGDRPHFDLWAANEQALRDSGVVHIEQSGICTASTTTEFFSHRAEHGKTGRFGTLIVMA